MDPVCSELQARWAAGGATALLEQLLIVLRERKDYHKLFDARCLMQKQRMGLPIDKPTSFDDVPADRRAEFEPVYLAAAREVGGLLLADGQIGQAWVYFHAIRETAPVRQALEAYVIPREGNDQSEEYLEVALFKQVHPVKGVQIMLKTHGTCSTITALDQAFARLAPDERGQCAALMVRTLHAELVQSVQRDVAQRMPFAPPAQTLRELTAGRDWLFADNNYHIDVSHLHATVRFARSLPQGAAELALANDLTEYGQQLAAQFQYAGEPPFQDYYPAHQRFFRILQGVDVEASLAWFRQQLAQEPDAPDQALIAYVLVDLLVRIGQPEAAIPIARQYLLAQDQEFVAAFAELCQRAKALNVLQDVAAERGDLLLLATALLQAEAVSAS